MHWVKNIGKLQKSKEYRKFLVFIYWCKTGVLYTPTHSCHFARLKLNCDILSVLKTIYVKKSYRPFLQGFSNTLGVRYYSVRKKQRKFVQTHKMRVSYTPNQRSYFINVCYT